MNFWVELFNICFDKWVVSHCEREPLKVFEFKFIIFSIIVFDWPLVLFRVKLFVLNFLNIVIACTLEVFFSLFDNSSSLHKLMEFLCKRCHLNGLLRIKDKMDNTAVCTFDGARFFTSCVFGNHGCFNSILLLCYDVELISYKFVNQISSLIKLLIVL